MQIWIDLLPLLVPMVLLLGMSAFFSASEAALFYLTASDQRKMSGGTAGERIAIELLAQPDRLLTAILFWNLVINVVYFSLASICSIRIERTDQLGNTEAVVFAFSALLTLIFFSEMVPKSVAVIAPRIVARACSLPLSFAVFLVDPLMPPLRSINKISTRILWPGFKPEQSIDVEDLENAILLSNGDEALIRQEQAVLRNIVQLSSITIGEWMRPRSQLDIYSPPVKLKDLEGEIPAGGYLMITEPDSLEIEKAIRLDSQTELPADQIEKLGEPVLYLPWTATIASALEKMSHRDREVTVVVNEYGETIGVLTIEDILETVFTYSPSRTLRLLQREPIQEIGPNRWHVMGMANLRLMARRLDIELPETSRVTVAGLIQEQLQRLAEKEDVCLFGPCRFEVIETGPRGSLVVELTIEKPPEEGE